MHMSQEKKQIFAGGTGRSGTTILLHTLRFHPEICCFYESRFLGDPGGIQEYFDGKISFDVFERRMNHVFWGKISNSFHNAYTSENYSQRLEQFNPGKQLSLSAVYTQDYLKEIMNVSGLESNRIHSHREFIQELFDRGTRLTGKKFWIEKTPHTIVTADYLYKLFPNMKYIHMIREPKELCCSVLERPWGPETVDEFLEWFNRLMPKAYRIRENIPSRNYRVFSLERLIAEKNKTLGTILDFLGISTGPEIIDLCVSQINDGKFNTGRWRTCLSRAEIARIDRECGNIYRSWKKLEDEG